QSRSGGKPPRPVAPLLAVRSDPRAGRPRRGGRVRTAPGVRRFGASREEVWKVLNDPAAMAKTMPGVESFDVHDDRNWTANVKIPLGLGGLKMKVDMEKVEEREPDFAKLAIKGKGVGAMMNMETSFTLSDAEGGTAMAWS